MFRIISTVLLSAALLSADTLTLTNGQVVSGSYLGGDSRSVRFAVGDRVTTYSLAEVRSIGFGEPQPLPVQAKPENAQMKVPAGWDIELRILQAVWPNNGGKTYRAENFADIIIGNQVLVPKGAECELASVEKPPAAALYAACRGTAILHDQRQDVSCFYQSAGNQHAAEGGSHRWVQSSRAA